MSDIKDEIDWEFPGNTTTQGQTNYFWQGVVGKSSSQLSQKRDLTVGSSVTPTHGTTVDGLADTFQNYHDYTVCSSLVLDGQVRAHTGARPD